MDAQLALFAPLPPSVEGMDIAKASFSYSADLIAMSGKVRKPVACGGNLWINTGTRGTAAHRIAEMYCLVAVAEFDGQPITYHEKTSIWFEGDAYPGDYARNDPNGFYHGMKVQQGGMSYVLCGPPQKLAINGLVELLDTTDDEEDFDDEDDADIEAA